MTFFLGVDVGTGSARAGLFDTKGQLIAKGERPIRTFHPAHDFAQQSSREIWEAVCGAVKDCVAISEVSPSNIVGIGFDATCSLVVSAKGGEPVSICPKGSPDQDVILWMDHRAIVDAEEITATKAKVLDHVGGVMSPEMELPKLRWLKRELPQAWKQAGLFWDLPDWLAWRATGSETRSICSPVCKWTYLAHIGQSGDTWLPAGWDQDFLKTIGLDDLAENNFSSIGQSFAPAGRKIGSLTSQSAEELGLSPDTAVSTGLIDAYAGALGTLAVTDDDDASSAVEGRLAVIAGTSTCHIVLSKSPHFVPGVWGPYSSALIEGYWANEGGQSAAGALIDSVLARHSATAQLKETANGRRVTDLLEDHLALMGEKEVNLAVRHVQPDFHGNRSPLAEPWRGGAIVGLNLDGGLDDLALNYLATQQALAYGTRHIIEVMRRSSVVVDTLVLSGGLARNKLYQQEHADVTGCKVIVPDQSEPVLLGSAMIAAAASGAYSSLLEAMTAMSGPSRTIQPRLGKISRFHDAKYRVFRRMQDDFAAYRDIMNDVEGSVQ